MSDINSKLKDFTVKYRSKCFALVNWKNLQARDYTLTEMLECIYEAANGSFQKMSDIIDHLTVKKKVMGRSQVHANDDGTRIDLRRDENGKLRLLSYNPNEELPLKGQHRPENPKIFRKDGQVNRNFERSEERMHDFGKKVRDMFPNEDNHFITFAMQAIKKYADLKKIHTDKVLKGLEKNRYKLDTDRWTIVPNVSESRIIVINESDLNRVEEAMKMTEHKFFVNMKYFISQLLQDPVNAKVPAIFSQRGYTRSSLLPYLLGGKDPILKRTQNISDKDENGNPKTATMKVKFMCPKKNFERKLEKLYIRMFERNLPKRNTVVDTDVDEATGCGANGAAGGAFVGPLSFSGKQSDVIRRQMPTEIGESTTTMNVGDYTYDEPAFGDKESLARKNGKGGSVSVNTVKKH